MHAWLHLVANQPQLLIDHAHAYADLAVVQMARMSARWKRRLVLCAVALGGGVVASMLAGVALMLWSVTPALPARAILLLIVVPLVPALVAAGCLTVLHVQRGTGSPTQNLWQQFKADLQVLGAAGGT
jgi:hypothetical protein